MTTDIENLMEEVLGRDLEMARPNLIHPEGSGYRVFEHYHITGNGDRVRVKKDPDLEHEFTSARSALSWCIADKYRQRVVAADIVRLDQRRRELRDDIAMSRQLQERSREYHQREIVEAKISHKRQLLHDADSRLDKCVALTKYWQIRGFNDELARTRRPASNTTNRPHNRKSAR